MNPQRLRCGAAAQKNLRALRANDDDGQAAGEGFGQEVESGAPTLVMVKLERAKLVEDEEVARRGLGKQRVAPGERLAVKGPVSDARSPQLAANPAGEPAAGARVRGQSVETDLSAMPGLGRRKQAEHSRAGLFGLLDQSHQQAGLSGAAPAGEQDQLRAGNSWLVVQSVLHGQGLIAGAPAAAQRYYQPGAAWAGWIQARVAANVRWLSFSFARRVGGNDNRASAVRLPTLMNRMRHIALWVWLLGLGCTGAAAAETDWPMFRGGPALTGVAAGSLPAQLRLLWTFKTGGPVKASPAIAQGRVFIGSDDGNVYALGLADGRKVWAFKTEGEVESSPLVLEGKVYAGSSDAFLYALEAATGKLVWKYETGSKISGAPNWVKTSGGRRVLAGSHDYKLHCVDAATGRSNWVYETSNYINGAPAVAGGQTVFGGCDGLLHVISLAEGKQVRQVEAGAYIAGSVALADGRAYFGQYENEFLCVDLKEGRKVWSFHDRDFPYFSSPAVTPEFVVFGGRDKRLHCVKRADGQAVWSFSTRGKVDSSPVVCGDKVIVGSDDGRLYVVTLAAGKALWSYEIGEPIESSPAVAGGRVVVGGNDGGVYCFGEK